MPLYIHQLNGWPQFTRDEEALATNLVEVRSMQHNLLGRMAALGFDPRNEADLAMMIEDVLRTSEIAGELLDPEKVRSSLARRLGLDLPDLTTKGMLEKSQQGGRSTHYVLAK